MSCFMSCKEEILKSCPFCGNKKIKFYRKGNSHYAYCIICQACSRDNSISTSEDIVISQWNNRIGE